MDSSNIYIIKKDNTKEAFNVQKVVVAVSKSAERVMYHFSEKELEYICDFVTRKCEEMDQQFIPIAS